MLIHRGAGDKGSFTLTANRLEYPQGRLAPDITVDQENRTSVSISWTESKKTHNSLIAPETYYEIYRRTLPDENWSFVDGRISLGNRTYEVTGLTAGTAYEIRVRMVPLPGVDTYTYQWGYATVYTDDCAETGVNICSISVNQLQERPHRLRLHRGHRRFHNPPRQQHNLRHQSERQVHQYRHPGGPQHDTRPPLRR